MLNRRKKDPCMKSVPEPKGIRGRETLAAEGCRNRVWCCCLIAVAFLAACGDKIEPGNLATGPSATVKAEISAARFTTQPQLYEAVGTVKARTASTISGKLMGTVKAIRVNEGDIVKEGDVLVVIDDRQVSAQLRQTEAALAEARRAEASAKSAMDSAQARAELARSTYERYVKLMQDDSASQQEFDEVAAQKRQAEASFSQTTAMLEAAGQRIQQAEATLASAQVGKRDALVRAPYEGRVTAKMVEVGDLASPGTPFVTLEQSGAYCVDIVLPESLIQSVRLDQEVEVTIPGMGDRRMTGRIGRIVPTADQKSRSFLVKVALPDGTPVRSGMFARVAVPVGSAGMLLIPATAVVQRGQMTGIYLLDGENVARFRLIRTGRIVAEAVEVISGLKDGDRYVVEPPVQLANGSRVEVSP